jgi:hypothetical protein
MLPPLDRAGLPVDVASLVARIHGARGASIEGPHGTGKSTWLAAIAKALEEAGLHGGTVRLRTRRDRMVALTVIRHAVPGSFVCLDGWEVLGSLAIVVRCLAWWRGIGLVVTSHRAIGFPCVIRTAATLPLLAAIVDRLPEHGGLGGGLIDEADLAAALAKHPGDLREALLDLYDRFEHRARMDGS